ncbi:MAG: tRNA (guanosine(46)-N7)-methyltransferase TrmB [Bradymonadia bacterium]
MKSPNVNVPEGAAGEVMLNTLLFGTNARGGHQTAPDPESLPVLWPEVFNREAPLTLEIGFNRGVFLRALAEQWPDHNHVGVELRRRYPYYVAQQVADAGGMDNLKIVWGDAHLVVPAIFAPGSLQAVFINFPDPWWKKRHAKRRLVNLDYAHTLAGLLAPGGRIWVKSDVPMIADEIREAFEQVSCLEGPTPFGEADLPFTHRERRCVAAEMPIVRYWFDRVAGDPAP